MQEKIERIGLIGTGTMAEYHVRGFQEAGAQIGAIVEHDFPRAEAFARKWELNCPLYHSIEEMLAAQTSVQAVSIITPNKFHCPLALEALNAGLHVFCEKPPALNAEEAERMEKAARANRRALMFNLNNRARMDSQFVKNEIRKGRIGQVNSAEAVWKRRTGIPGFGGWFTSKAVAGGGPLIDLPHMIDLALWFMEYPEPEYVLAQTFSDFINDPDFCGSWGKATDLKAVNNDVESACHGFVRFKTGQVLSLHVSWAELIKEEDTYVTLQTAGTGVLIRTVNEKNSCELYSQKEGVSMDRSFRFRSDHDMGRTHAPENFIRSLNGEAEPLTRAHEATLLMRLIDAVYLSARSGKPVKVLKHGCKPV